MESESQLTVGQTIYIHGKEMLITQIRLDEHVAGNTAMIMLADPILFTKDKMDRELKEELVRKQIGMANKVTESLS